MSKLPHKRSGTPRQVPECFGTVRVKLGLQAVSSRPAAPVLRLFARASDLHARRRQTMGRSLQQTCLLVSLLPGGCSDSICIAACAALRRKSIARLCVGHLPCMYTPTPRASPSIRRLCVSWSRRPTCNDIRYRHGDTDQFKRALLHVACCALTAQLPTVQCTVNKYNIPYQIHSSSAGPAHDIVL